MWTTAILHPNWMLIGAEGNHISGWAGDNTVLGWLTTASYLVALLLCVRAARRWSLGGIEHSRMFWTGLAGLLLVLGLNKQLDLQTAMIDSARWVAKQQGWYDQRRPVQATFVVLLAAVALACLIWFVWLTRGAWRNHAMALFGATLLIAFVLLRAAYFERMDEWTGLSLAASRAKWVLELGGIACIAVSAARTELRPPR